MNLFGELYLSHTIIKSVLGAAFLCLIFAVGCEEKRIKPVEVVSSCDISGYGAESVHIVGLTELVEDSENTGQHSLKVFVDVLDCIDSRIKSPGFFRFELYEYIPRSSQSKGKRLYFWPDVDLTEVTVNNDHWREHLRAYEFELSMDFELPAQDRFVLEVTFTTPAGRRFNDIYQLKYPGQD